MSSRSTKPVDSSPIPFDIDRHRKRKTAAAGPKVVGRNIDVDKIFVHFVKIHRSQVSSAQRKPFEVVERKRHKILCDSFPRSRILVRNVHDDWKQAGVAARNDVVELFDQYAPLGALMATKLREKAAVLVDVSETILHCL